MTVVDLCPFFWNAMCISQFKGLALLCLIRNTCFTVHGWWWWHIFLNSMIQHHIHHDSYNAWNWHPFPGAINLIKSIIMSSHPITYMCCWWWWFSNKFSRAVLHSLLGRRYPWAIKLIILIVVAYYKKAINDDDTACWAIIQPVGWEIVRFSRSGQSSSSKTIYLSSIWWCWL